MGMTTKFAPALITALVIGCAEGEGLGPTYDTEPELDTEGVMVPDGHYWCVRAVGATVDAGGTPVEIRDEANQWVRGCACASPSEDDALEILDSLDGSNNGATNITDMSADDLVVIRNNAREDAEINCEAIADSDYGGVVFDDDCEEEVDDEISVFKRSPDIECVAAERIGTDPGMTTPPSDEYSDYYTLSQVIVFNSGQNRTYIDAAFFDDMLQNPGWLLNDAARIVVDTSSTPRYKFTIPGTFGVAYKLGIRNNDRAVSINGYTLSGGMLDALAAYEALSTATTFNFVVKRNGVNVTLQYTVQ